MKWLSLWYGLVFFCLGCHATVIKESALEPKRLKLTRKLSPEIFKSLDEEVKGLRLDVMGELPEWLKGNFVQIIPGKVETKKQKMAHYFDGFAMLASFSLGGATATYTNKFLETKYYKKAQELGRLEAKGFGTSVERSFVGGGVEYLKNLWNYGVFSYDNTNQSIGKFADWYVARTGVPEVTAFDLDTLETLGTVKFQDELKGHVATAHPVRDAQTSEFFNVSAHFGKKSFYTIYKHKKDEAERTVLVTIPTTSPSYVHSLGLTNSYVIFIECPLVARPRNFILSNKPYIKNFEWKPEVGSQISLIDRVTGEVVFVSKIPTKFILHHINAYEQGDKVFLDCATHDDPDIIESFYTKNLHDLNHVFPDGYVERYELNLKQKASRLVRMLHVPLEFPSINSSMISMKSYHYVYGICLNEASITKVNLTSGEVLRWFSTGCHPSRPVFVPKPDARDEDDGVLLSTVYDQNANRTFVLVLDAKNLEERARISTIHTIPFSLHGIFVTQESSAS